MTPLPRLARSALFGLAFVLLADGSLTAQEPSTYRFLATAESDDQVVLAEFTPCTESTRAQCGVRTIRTYEVGLWPAEIEGPHGVVVSPDGASFFVTLAHGRPFGYLQRIDMVSGEETGLVELGMFPATVDLSPLTGLIFAINFNFEDPTMAQSSVSVVDGSSVAEVARTATCRMPHGSRVNPQGTHHYSGCMMNDLLVEVSTRSFAVTRFFDLTPGAEGPSTVEGPHVMSNRCSPTWAQPSADGSSVYVACNKSAEIVEVATESWSMRRRWPTPPAPYNLAVTPDGGLLIATQKGPGTTSVWRLSDATLLADIKNSRSVASGVAVSLDSRYAFVTLEGVGGEPGTVDVIDLRRLAQVASLDMGKQAGGIAMVPRH